MKPTRRPKTDSHSSAEFFCPPLWMQRRNFIQDILNKHEITSVLDYGCGEAAVLSFLISPTENSIVKMAGIDIDEESLVEAIDRCVPWKADLQHPRSRPLIIDVFKGSIGIPDDRLKGYQAIVCTEVIEHVYPDVLDSFLDLTLGVYQPQILIVTTPNGEYNVNFPELKYNTSEYVFRHDDHKFEWTREEFKQWCEAGAAKHKYNTEYHGIGLLHQKPNEVEHGHCTQACVFIRQASTTDSSLQQTMHGQPHQLLKHIEFPYYNEPPPPRQQIIKELECYIETLCKADCYVHQEQNKHAHKMNHNEEDKDTIEIDLSTDWNSFNIENYSLQEYVPFAPKESIYTQTPLHLNISSLWNILRVQQICETQENMVSILKTEGNESDYKVEEDTDLLIVYKSYRMDSDDDNYSASTVSQDLDE